MADHQVDWDPPSEGGPDVVTPAEQAAFIDEGQAAGGVLSGTYPDPGFAVDMATQAELGAEADTRADVDSAEATARGDADAAEATARDAADDVLTDGLAAELLTRAAADKAVVITTQADDYTLALGDAGTEVEGTKGTAQTITVPPNADVAFPVGTIINVRQMGAGQITVAAGAGVTLRIPGGAKTRVQYSTVTLVKRAVNEWCAGGDATT